MRSPLIVAISTWLVATATLAVAADKPIPQDPAFIKKRSEDWLAWNRLTLGDAYKKLGKKDLRWDKLAEAALELAARMFSQQTDSVMTHSKIFPEARKAVDAGCTDPLILYLYAQTSVDPNFPGEAEFIRRVQRGSDALMNSGYSPFRKASSLLRATQLKARSLARPPTPEQVKTIEAGVEGIFDLLAKSAQVDPRGEFWEARWYDNLDSTRAEANRAGGDVKAIFERFDARLAKIPGIEALRLSLKGRYLIDAAWKARSNRIAPLVSGKQFQSFDSLLTDARSTLEAAYKINPKQPLVAQNMLSVELGIGQGDRDAMELWFTRALELDPDDYKSCWVKMNWLAPKWYGAGDDSDLLAFGKACAASGSWKNEITLLGPDSINIHSETFPPHERAKYLAEIENWNLISSVYDEYLKHYPDNSIALSKYAFFASFAGRLEVANQMFKRVGDKLTGWTDPPNISLDKLKLIRDAIAKKAEEDRKAKAAQAPKA